MRIKCPECESVLSLGQPKPGSYRPTCKHCHKRFRLKITADDPPKVGVGRITADTDSKRVSGKQSKQSKQKSPVSSPSKPPPVAPKSVVAATMDPVDARATVEATMDSPAPSMKQPALPIDFWRICLVCMALFADES